MSIYNDCVTQLRDSLIVNSDNLEVLRAVVLLWEDMMMVNGWDWNEDIRPAYDTLWSEHDPNSSVALVLKSVMDLDQ